MEILEHFQLEALCMIVDAPWYVLNMVTRGIPWVKEEIRCYSSQYSACLSAHPKDSVALVHEQTIPSDRILSMKLVSTLLIEGVVWSAWRITEAVQCTSKQPNSEPHGATRQQAVAKTLAKWTAYQIPSVTVVFVVLVLVCEAYFQKPQEATQNLLHAIVYIFTQCAEFTSTHCK
jgi:hypothetical protein